MVRIKKCVASRQRRKRLMKLAKGFFGDRRGHVRQTKNAVMKALQFATAHRKRKKGDFRRLWIQRINVAARINGLSYSKLICGMERAGCLIDRKMLADLAVTQPEAFAQIAASAKAALV